VRGLAGVAALTLGFLSVVPAETPEVDKNSNAAGEMRLPASWLMRLKAYGHFRIYLLVLH